MVYICYWECVRVSIQQRDTTHTAAFSFGTSYDRYPTLTGALYETWLELLVWARAGHVRRPPRTELNASLTRYSQVGEALVTSDVHTCCFDTHPPILDKPTHVVAVLCVFSFSNWSTSLILHILFSTINLLRIWKNLARKKHTLIHGYYMFIKEDKLFLKLITIHTIQIIRMLHFFSKLCGDQYY